MIRTEKQNYISWLSKHSSCIVLFLLLVGFLPFYLLSCVLVYIMINIIQECCVHCPAFFRQLCCAIFFFPNVYPHGFSGNSVFLLMLCGVVSGFNCYGKNNIAYLLVRAVFLRSLKWCPLIPVYSFTVNKTSRRHLRV